MIYNRDVAGFDMSKELLCTLDPIGGTPTKTMARDFGFKKTSGMIGMLSRALSSIGVRYRGHNIAGEHCIVIEPADRERLQFHGEAYWSRVYERV